MELDDLAQELFELCENKYKPMTPDQRLLAVMRQLADASGAVAVRDGAIVNVGHTYQEAPHRIACLLAEVLILARQEKIDLDHEMKRVLEFYRQK